MKVFPHQEYNSDKFSNIDIVKKKISNLEDLFERGHKYTVVDLDQSFPEIIFNNKKKYKDYIFEQ